MVQAQPFLRVRYVVPGSSAYKQGVRAGMRLYKIQHLPATVRRFEIASVPVTIEFDPVTEVKKKKLVKRGPVKQKPREDKKKKIQKNPNPNKNKKIYFRGEKKKIEN